MRDPECIGCPYSPAECLEHEMCPREMMVSLVRETGIDIVEMALQDLGELPAPTE